MDCNDSSDSESSSFLLNTSFDENGYSDIQSTSSYDSEYKYMTCKLKPVHERIGYFLATTPPIIESIFSTLNAKDLNCCAQVCKLWNTQANILKGKRNEVLRMFKVIYSAPRCNPVDEADDIGSHFTRVLNNAPFEPNLGLIFCSETIISKPQNYFSGFTSRKLKKKDHRRFGYGALGADFMSYLLPLKCSYVICTASGVIGTPTDKVTPTEVEDNTGKCLSAVFLPEKLPGMEIIHFSVPDNRYKKKRQKVAEPKSEGILTDKNVKCVLFFLKHMPRPDGEFFKAFLANHFENGKPATAIAGVISQKIFYQNCNIDKLNTEDLGSGIAFTGQNVNAATIVLDPEVKTKEQVETKLRELKEGINLGKKTIALLLACCGRGVEHYNEENVESNCFNKVFPNIPLYGMFGNGEIGVDFLPNQLKTTGIKTEKEFKSNVFYSHTRRNRELSGSVEVQTWFHAYTSIFVLLTWN